jgi:hypothetical protein
LFVRLPNAERAVVDIRKLRDYCLDPDHPDGRHKARVFAATLGFTRRDAGRLRELLQKAATDEEATAGGEHPYGERFVIDFVVQGPHGPTTVRSAWLLRSDDGLPHLITCFVR